uniref:Polyprotein n=1 Tax=Solanum tuberosum TaxID=4113 RepID=M1DJ52_SOLTU
MKGHSRADCNKLKYCTHCHKHGHLKEVCYQLIGYPASYKGKKIANLVTSDFGDHPHIPGGLGAGSVPYIAPNQYNQDIIPPDDSQVPAQLPLSIIPDTHLSNVEEYHNDPVLENPTLDLPTQMHTSAITEESVMSSTIGRRHSNMSSRPSLWQKDFVTVTKSKSQSHCLYSLADSIDYNSLSHAYQGDV